MSGPREHDFDHGPRFGKIEGKTYRDGDWLDLLSAGHHCVDCSASLQDVEDGRVARFCGIDGYYGA